MPKALLLLTCLFAAACTTHRPRVAPSPTNPIQDYAEVLNQAVSPTGRIDFRVLQQNPAALERYVAHIAATDPARLPSPQAQIAHHVNAYNALAIYNVLVSGKIPSQVIDFFIQQRFDTGQGRIMNLYDYENKVIRAFNEPRIHFVLNCVSASCPRLRQQPIAAETFNEQLDAATIEFINDPQHVTIDHATQTVTISEIFEWFEKDFLIESPNLIAYLNRYHHQTIPDDYRVKFHTFDFNLAGPKPI